MNSFDGCIVKYDSTLNNQGDTGSYINATWNIAFCSRNSKTKSSLTEMDAVETHGEFEVFKAASAARHSVLQ